MRYAYLQSLSRPVRLRRAPVRRRLRGFGADEAPATETETLVHDAQLAREMLKAQQAMVAAQQEQALWQKRWTEADVRQRYFQIAAILAVPLAGVFWRWFLGSRTAARLGID